MLKKFFVALTFSENSTSKKIQGFRKRYDPKYTSHEMAHMSMLAPFEILSSDKSELVDSLKDEIENFFMGSDVTPKLSFKGLDVYRHKRTNILYLNPDLGDDLGYCLEGVSQVCRDLIPPNVGYKPNTKQFLPLGYFPTEEALGKIMPMASLEFANISDLYVSGITLFEKRLGLWMVVEELIAFEDPNENFLQLQHVST